MWYYWRYSCSNILIVLRYYSGTTQSALRALPYRMVAADIPLISSTFWPKMKNSLCYFLEVWISPLKRRFNGKMENDLLFSVYYLLLSESILPSTTGLKLLYPKLFQVFQALLFFHAGSPRSTPLPLSKCSMLYSKLNYFYLFT